MIHFRTDGDVVRNGLNIYRFWNSTTWGIVLRYGERNAKNLGRKIFVFRYDRLSQQFTLANIGVE